MCDPASVLMLQREEQWEVNGTYKYGEGYSGPIMYLEVTLNVWISLH